MIPGYCLRLLTNVTFAHGISWKSTCVGRCPNISIEQSVYDWSAVIAMERAWELSTTQVCMKVWGKHTKMDWEFQLGKGFSICPTHVTVCLGLSTCSRPCSTKLPPSLPVQSTKGTTAAAASFKDNAIPQLPIFWQWTVSPACSTSAGESNLNLKHTHTNQFQTKRITERSGLYKTCFSFALDMPRRRFKNLEAKSAQNLRPEAGLMSDFISPVSPLVAIQHLSLAISIHWNWWC